MALETRMRLYLAALVVSCLTSAVLLALVVGWAGNPAVVATLAVIAALAERGRVRLSAALQGSISLVPTLFAAVLFGPIAAMIVASASMLLELRPAPGTPSPYLRWGIYTCTRSLTGAVVGVVVAATGDPLHNEFLTIALVTSVGALVGEVLDGVWAGVTLHLRRVADSRHVLLTAGPLSLAAVPLYTPVVAVLAYAYRDLSPLTLPLFFVPALAAQRLFGLYQHQRELTDDLISANETLERANLSFASALVATLDARDRYTAGHSAAVAIYARDIARRLGLDERQQRLAHLAGLVHDIGKIGLPAGLLEKPGALTLEERRQMERHSIIGERILANVETYSEVAEVVRHHHERFDGNGYPDGLKETGIPLLARIIAVADAYNAMTSDRPYRDAMSSRVARLRLAQAAAAQFDTTVVAAFEAILAPADEEYQTAQRPDFKFVGVEVNDKEHEGARLERAEESFVLLKSDNRFGSGPDTQFLEDVPHVDFDRRLANE